MGMGYGANFTETVEEKAIKAICPEHFDTFAQAIKEANVEDIEEFALGFYHGDEAEDLETGKAYKQLCSAFHYQTGLTIGIGYHDVDGEGDRYDDINGYYWWILEDDVYKKTANAKKFEALGHKIERKFFVTFG